MKWCKSDHVHDLEMKIIDHPTQETLENLTENQKHPKNPQQGVPKKTEFQIFSDMIIHLYFSIWKLSSVLGPLINSGSFWLILGQPG